MQIPIVTASHGRPFAPTSANLGKIYWGRLLNTNLNGSIPVRVWLLEYYGFLWMKKDIRKVNELRILDWRVNGGDGWIDSGEDNAVEAQHLAVERAAAARTTADGVRGGEEPKY